jgi:hypothetical protein
MKEISKEQQEELDDLYERYYTYLCKWHLGHSLEELHKPFYHKNDFRVNLEEEAHSIKVNYGY